jgi:hypothetical protein
VLRLEFTERSGVFYLSDREGAREYALPVNFLPSVFHQFRFIKRSRSIYIDTEGVPVAEFDLPDKAQIALWNRNGVLALDMARLTVF